MHRRRHRGLATLGLLALSTAAVLAAPTSADAARTTTPRPVYTDTGEVADPGVVRDGNDYYAYTTALPLGHVARANTPQGPWVVLDHGAVANYPAWASGVRAVWAPDAVHTSAGWVLYFSLEAKGFNRQRCIGTAVADTPAGPFTPSDTPLICPLASLGGEDLAADRPDTTSGVIDPAPFQASDGQRYLLYKTQKTPGTIRMVEMSSDGLHATGISKELVRHSDSIENPAMVQRGSTYVLFASVNWYNQCKYATAYRTSDDPWSWTDKEEHILLDQANTGICGPGGADVVADGNGPDRIFLHGWVCDAANDPCQWDEASPVPGPKRRVMYAAVLGWGADGVTPTVRAFLPPVG